MSRGKKGIEKIYSPDIVYGSTLITKFFNIVMQDGKKVVAQKIVYEALDLAKQKILEKYKTIAEGFEAIIEDIAPTIMTKTKRIGGSNYQIPIPVSKKKKISIGMTTLVEVSRAKKGISIAKAMSHEIIAIIEGTGSESLKKKANIEKMAAANKAYAHLA